MDLRILGAPEIHDDRRVVVPRRRMVRMLLGTLALRSNVALSRDDLTDALWERKPPASAAANLRSYVAELRRLLGTGHPAGPSVEATAGGYRLRIGAVDLDALRFETLAADGRRMLAANDYGAAGDLLARALVIWRGPVLGGLAVPDLVADDARALDERRLNATEDSMAAQLALGRHAMLIPELESLVNRHSIRERLWGQLMLALYRGGRQAEALSTYRRLYRLLADELGVEPGSEIQRLHRRILRAEEDLRLRESVAVRPIPWQLPPVPGSFTGREKSLRELDALARPGPRDPLAIAILTGTAGVGKTALALRWAHRARDRFPDGCLYADMRGYGPDRPRTADEVLAEFLDALDAPSAEPVTGRYRTELTGRRMLIVLDNAFSVEQVRPLLPSDSCTVLVTSRDALNGLVVRDGARRIDVDRLTESEAGDLLRGLIGTRADAAPQAVADLAHRCAMLPLALRIGADLVTLRPAVALTTLVREFATERGRLDILATAGGSDPAIRTVFSWSLAHLSRPARRGFGLLGLHPGQHTDAASVAALLGSSGSAVIADLIRAHLIEEIAPGRYSSHDLLREYAAEIAAALPATDRRAALTRLLDQQVVATSQAMDLVYPTEFMRRPRLVASGVPIPALDLSSAPGDVAAARQWLETETGNLLALAALAAGRGWDGHLDALSGILQRHLHTGGRYVDALRISEWAEAAARRRADRGAEAWARSDVALSLFRLNRHGEAAEHFERARTLHGECGDQLGESVSLRGIGMVRYRQGRPTEALSPLSQALAICRQLGDRGGEGSVLCNIGLVHEWTGDWAQALRCYRQALAIHRELGFLIGEGDVLNNIGIVHRQTGDHSTASAILTQALAIYRTVGDRGGEGAVLNNLGLVGIQLGAWPDAQDHLDAALAVHKETHQRVAELETRNIRAELAYRSGKPADALARFREAMALAVELADSGSEMNAHRGLGEALLACGDAEAACRHYRSALAMARASGARRDEAYALAGIARCLDSDTHRRQAVAIFNELGIEDDG